MKYKNIIISYLRHFDAMKLYYLLVSDPLKYRKYFHPFELKLSYIANMLKKKKKDCYWGIYIDKNLAGMFMLRGFNEGYKRPSFGLYIGKKYMGKGLGKFALYYAMTWCRINRIKSMMLKTYDENKVAKKLYIDNGFILIRRDDKTGMGTYEKKLD